MSRNALCFSVRQYAEAIGTKCLWRIYEEIGKGNIPTFTLPGIRGLRIPAQWVHEQINKQCGQSVSAHKSALLHIESPSLALAGGEPLRSKR